MCVNVFYVFHVFCPSLFSPGIITPLYVFYVASGVTQTHIMISHNINVSHDAGVNTTGLAKQKTKNKKTLQHRKMAEANVDMFIISRTILDELRL